MISPQQKTEQDEKDTAVRHIKPELTPKRKRPLNKIVNFAVSITQRWFLDSDIAAVERKVDRLSKSGGSATGTARKSTKTTSTKSSGASSAKKR